MIDLAELRSVGVELFDEGCKEESVLICRSADRIEELCIELDSLRAKLREAEEKNAGVRAAYDQMNDAFMEANDEIARLHGDNDRLRDLVEEARDAIALADKMLSEHIEKYHDYDYEPHQVPPELADLRGIEHHLMGSLILDEDTSPLPSTERRDG